MAGLWSIGLGAALLYAAAAYGREGEASSVMIRREPDTELDSAITEQLIEELSATLSHGDWILSRSYTLHGDLLDLIQPRSAASHVGIYDAVNNAVVESVREGVRSIPLEKFVHGSHSFVVIHPSEGSDDERRLSVEAARRLIGKKFDILGVLGIYNSPNRWYCAELVYDAFKLPKERRVHRPTDLLDHGAVVYAGLRTNRALRRRAEKRLTS